MSYRLHDDHRGFISCWCQRFNRFRHLVSVHQVCQSINQNLFSK